MYIVSEIWDTNQNPRTLIPVFRTRNLKSVADCSQFTLNFPVWRRLITHTILLYRALYWPLRLEYKTFTNSVFLVFKHSFAPETLDYYQSIKTLVYKYSATHTSTRLTQFTPQTTSRDTKHLEVPVRHGSFTCDLTASLQQCSTRTI
jgi:hypothetical protein